MKRDPKQKREHKRYTPEERKVMAEAEIQARIDAYTAKYGPCKLEPGVVLKMRDDKGHCLGVDGKDYPVNYQHGGILHDFWMEELYGNAYLYLPKRF